MSKAMAAQPGSATKVHSLTASRTTAMACSAMLSQIVLALTQFITGPARIGRYLYDHPEGVTHRFGPRSEPATASSLSHFIETIKACPDSSFHEMTGKKGDVILMHPLMLHSASKNGRRKIRKYHSFVCYMGLQSIPFHAPLSTQYNLKAIVN